MIAFGRAGTPSYEAARFTRATDAFNETLTRVSEEVAQRCNLSIATISELLVTGWAFTPGAPNQWTAPAPPTEHELALTEAVEKAR